LRSLCRAAAAAADANATALAERVRTFSALLAKAVPGRQLLPAMVEVMLSAVQAGAPTLSALLQLLGTQLQLSSEVEARAQAAHVFELLHCALSFRADHTLGSPCGDFGATRIEALASATLGAFAVRLNEDAFTTFFTRALERACVQGSTEKSEDKTPSTPSAATTTAATAGATLRLARALSFFRVSHGAQIALRSFFTQYFLMALPHATALLKVRVVTKQVMTPFSTKKRKVVTDAPVVVSQVEIALARAIANYLEVGFTHPVGVAPPDLREIEGALISRLVHPSSVHIEEPLLLALGAIVASIGEEGCKPLHYALCMATRSDAAYQRRSAVRGLTRMYATLRDAALMHMPEAVPFLSELLEDGESEVRSEALALMRTLERLNGGESLLE